MQRGTSLSPKELKEKLDSGEPLVVVDVREPDEYEGWNIAGSRNVPLDAVLSGATFVRDAPLVTVCSHGRRSEMARQHLAKQGYDVASLAGGMVAWNGVLDAAPVASTAAKVVQFRRVGKGCLSYMLASGGEAIVIDATAQADVYLEFARTRGWRIVKALDTHAHADHVSGARMLVARTGAEYHVPDEVGPHVPHKSVREGQAIRVGSVELRPLATPGHTPGSVTYLLGDLAFTGDTLFVESVGRPDLGQDARPNAQVLFDTLHRKLLTLPSETRVLPAHYGPAVTLEALVPISATLEELRSRIPALAWGADRFVEWVVANAMPKPENFDLIKRVNQGLASVEDPEDVAELEAGANRCAVSA